ncbi:MAG: alpha/beta fold hydrolase, partial [Thermoflexales bacterium]
MRPFRLFAICISVTVMSACGAPPPPAVPATASPALAPTVTAIVPATAPPTLTPIATARPDAARPQDLRLKTEDGAALVARQWGGGPDWVILSSNGDGRSARWLPLAEALAKQGWAVLTYDWRGTNPDAPGQSEWTLAVTDARAALAHARAQGAQRIVLAGGSLGGIASIKLGAERDVTGVIAVGTPYTVAPLTVNVDDLKAIRGPRLFVASAGDTIVPSSETQWLHDNAPMPKSIHTYPGTAHGVELLGGSDRQDFIDRVVAFVSAAFTGVAGGGTPAGQRWREDLRALSDALKAIHPKLFFKGNETEVNGLIAALDARLDTLSDEQVKAGLLRIAAQFDGHTRIYFGQAAMAWHLYGLRLYAFSDGLRVIGARPPFEDLLGAKLARIGDIEAGVAMERLRPYVEHDNESWFRFLAPTYLMIPELLAAEGLIADTARPNLVFERANGTTATVQPGAIDIAAFRAWMPLFGLPARAEPLWLSRKSENFWMTCLKDCRALYIQYNAIQPRSGDESLSAFAGRARDLIRGKSIPRVVLDLRHNGGGDNTTYWPLLSVFQSDEVNQAGRLYVITGRNTFSAAANFAAELERST